MFRPAHWHRVRVGRSGAVWVVAAINGYVLETIWLPAVAAAWPRRARVGVSHGYGSITAKEPR